MRAPRTPEGTLRALAIPLELDPKSGRLNVKAAIKRALLFYHPDKHQVRLCVGVHVGGSLCTAGGAYVHGNVHPP
jgi:hypothetical protein